MLERIVFVLFFCLPVTSLAYEFTFINGNGPARLGEIEFGASAQALTLNQKQAIFSDSKGPLAILEVRNFKVRRCGEVCLEGEFGFGNANGENVDANGISFALESKEDQHLGISKGTLTIKSNSTSSKYLIVERKAGVRPVVNVSQGLVLNCTDSGHQIENLNLSYQPFDRKGGMPEIEIVDAADKKEVYQGMYVTAEEVAALESGAIPFTVVAVGPGGFDPNNTEVLENSIILTLRKQDYTYKAHLAKEGKVFGLKCSKPQTTSRGI